MMLSQDKRNIRSTITVNTGQGPYAVCHGEGPLSHGMTSLKESDLPQGSCNTAIVKYNGE
jgi:hypothetical protein